MEQSAFYVCLFGKFSLSDGSTTLTQEMIHSERVTKLAAYLILHRREGCAFQRLIDDLWPNSQSGNPVNTLKNIVYRLRKTLAEIWPERPFILTTGGKYQWNPEIPLQTDLEEFDHLLQGAAESEERSKRCALLEQAVGTCHEKVLADFSGDHWILYLRTHYHQKYLNGVRELAAYLEEDRRYADLEALCAEAVILEPYDESVHGYLFKAYLGENLPAVAERHYRNMERVLMEHLGVEPSEELRNLYNNAMERRHRKELNLDVIEGELMEERQASGACRCTYNEFRKIFELETRRKERLGSHIVLGRVTVEPVEGDESQWNVETLLNMAFNELEETVITSLRTEDVVSRYSDRELLVLLFDCTLEDTKRIYERMSRKTLRFRKRWRKVKFGYSLKELSDGKEWEADFQG